MLSDPDLWTIVERAGADPDPTAALTDILERRPLDDAIRFDGWLHDQLRRAATTDLWRAAALLTGEADDASFEYFRVWLVFQGHTVYQQALSDPDSLARVAPGRSCYQLDGPQYVAWLVYRSRTGERLPARRRPPRHLSAVWSGDPDQPAAERFPHIWALTQRHICRTDDNKVLGRSAHSGDKS